jgi:hypothetical protein
MDILPRDAARADLPKVSTVYPDRVGGGVTVGPIAAAYFALPVALAAEMLAPTAVEEVAGAAVGETLSTVTPESHTSSTGSAFTDRLSSVKSISNLFIMALLDLQIIW